MLPILLGILAISVLSLMYLSYMARYDKKEAADQLAREYILRMETEGYLTDESKNNLIRSMENLGYTNINLSGTTMTDAGYGNQIMLVINASLETDKINVTDYLGINKGREETRLYICKKTTAKN